MSQVKKEPLINKSLIDLKEMLERENKLLNNKKFIEKLKDNGDKVRKFRDEIEKTIKIKESIEETESFLAKLSLNKKGILPNHPMFSANCDDTKSFLQLTNDNSHEKDVIKEILNEKIDIFSIVINQKFNEDLCQRRSERFILNRIPKSRIVSKHKQSKLSKDVEMKCEKLNENFSSVANCSTLDQNLNQQSEKTDNQLPLIKDQSTNKINLFQKYKDTALEIYEKKSKFVPLSIENSLEFGREQKVKDFKIEKMKLDNRLEWRKIVEFASDESDDSELSEEED